VAPAEEEDEAVPGDRVVSAFEERHVAMAHAEPTSIRLPDGSRERAEKLIPYLKGLNPHQTITRHTVFRVALMAGLTYLEDAEKALRAK
jgi:hypothetical protein